MLENQLACDVWFSVGPGRERVGAHRYVLQSRSGVFFAMFDEPGDELTEISLPETSPKVFWQFLRSVNLIWPSTDGRRYSLNIGLLAVPSA